MAAGRLPVVVRPQAQADIDDAIGHYLAQADVNVASRFAEAVVHALELLARQPAAGSSRYALLLALPGLRSWPLRPWPYLIFYIEGEQAVDVMRVLHGARDIPATLRESGDPV